MNKHFILILCFTRKILLIHIIRIARLILLLVIYKNPLSIRFSRSTYIIFEFRSKTTSWKNPFTSCSFLTRWR